MHTQTHRLLNPACTYVHGVISDPLNKNTAHPANIEFEFAGQVVFQLNSHCYTDVLQGDYTVS